MSLVAVRLKTSKLSGTRGFCWPETRDAVKRPAAVNRSEEHTSELQSQSNLVCRLLLENKSLFECPFTYSGTLRLRTALDYSARGRKSLWPQSCAAAFSFEVAFAPT